MAEFVEKVKTSKKVTSKKNYFNVEFFYGGKNELKIIFQCRFFFLNRGINLNERKNTYKKVQIKRKKVKKRKRCYCWFIGL